jgi:hypothetical protein
MKLEISLNDEVVSSYIGNFDIETAYEWIEAHGESHDWSDEYEYRLTDSEGKTYIYECDSFIEV